ncbi:hypothetical protein PAMC26577_35365 [Caballeronia sordidicola]|uniref:Mobile element protein n=1 Tax=Caballeronia sordidicola TaxID=196367 RepID=A0A2C9XUY9_CABSO|nr:hypothetical protein PAMC26577_35365 [Caballeronia sordidicola]
MGAAHFLMKTREHVSTEMSLHVLAYNLRRIMAILGTGTHSKIKKPVTVGRAERPSARR